MAIVLMVMFTITFTEVSDACMLPLSCLIYSANSKTHIDTGDLWYLFLNFCWSFDVYCQGFVSCISV